MSDALFPKISYWTTGRPLKQNRMLALMVVLAVPALACTLTSPPPDSADERLIGTAIAGAAGNEAPFVDAPVTAAAPASEPGGHIVFTCFIDGYDEICSMDADGSNLRQLTFVEATDWYAEFSPDGSQISFSTRRDNNFEIYVMGSDGSQPTRLTRNLGGNYAPTISPDGTLVTFSSWDGRQGHIWVTGISGSNPRQLTFESNNVDPIWSPDGQHIAFASDRNGATRELYIMDADGSNMRQLTIGADVGGRSDWSPDGSQLVFYAGPDNDKDAFIINADGSTLRQLTNGGNNKAPAFSPDGEWLTFASQMDADGDNEIFIMRTDGTDVRQLTFNQRPDWQPRWGP